MEEIKDKNLGSVVFEAVPLEDFLPASSLHRLNNRPENTIPVDLAVVASGVSEVLRVYQPICSPLDDLSFIVLPENSGNQGEIDHFHHLHVYSRYLKQYARCSARNSLRSEVDIKILAWYERRLNEMSDTMQALAGIE